MRLAAGSALLAALLVATLFTCKPADAAWVAPVGGEPVRLFDLGANPFERGRHRGVDLATARGEPVRAACRGQVVFAGRVAGTGTVSLRCGRWRVSHAPLARVTARAGTRVAAAVRLGSAAGPALHLGVRREGERFGYVDPLPFLERAGRAPPPTAPGPTKWGRRDGPRPHGPAVAAPAPTHPGPARPAPAGVAPGTVWLGLAVLLIGLVGAGRLSLPFRKQEEAPCRASSTSSSSPTTPSSP